MKTITVVLLLFVYAALAAMGLIGGDVAARADSASDTKLVVIIASGWQSTSDTKQFFQDWGEYVDALGGLSLPGNAHPVQVRQYSYSVAGEPYEKCETDNPLTADVVSLQSQVDAYHSQFPNAKMMILGHSLGGVVATRWLANPTNHSTATVVTLDSPVRGLTWAKQDEDVFHKAGARVISNQFCNSTVPDYINPQSSAVAEMATVAGQQRYYTGASTQDRFILAQDALLAAEPGHSQTFQSGDEHCELLMNIAMLGNPTVDLIAKIAACWGKSHGAVLHDGAAASWVAGIAESVLKAPTDTASPNAVIVPSALEQFTPIVEKLERALATHDANLLRQLLSSQPEFLVGNWGGAGTSFRVPIADANLEALLSSGARPTRIGKAVGAGATLPCDSCKPALGVVLSTSPGAVLFADAISGGGQHRTISAAGDEVMLVFSVSGRTDLPTDVFFGLVTQGPFADATPVATRSETATSTASSSPADGGQHGSSFVGTGLVAIDIPGDCLNVHTAPDVSAAVVLCAADGERWGTVSPDPVLVAGRYWWHIPDGWVLEDYLRRIVGLDCPGNCTPPPGRIGVFGTAIINIPGDCLNAHSAPNVSSRLTACVPDRTMVTVVGGPDSEGGFVWWLVSGPQVVEGCRPIVGGCGWVRADYLRPAD